MSLTQEQKDFWAKIVEMDEKLRAEAQAEREAYERMTDEEKKEYDERLKRAEERMLEAWRRENEENYGYYHADDDDDDYGGRPGYDYSPSCPWNAPGMSMSDFL